MKYDSFKILKNKKGSSNAMVGVQSSQKWALLSFIVMFIIFDLILTFSISYYTSYVIKDKLQTLINANGYQQSMNVGSYFTEVKDGASLMFSNEAYYSYDPVKNNIDEITKLDSEKKILERIQDIGVLRNYSDFAVIYSDDSTVGWIPEGTFKLVPNRSIYKFFSDGIDNPKTGSGWMTTEKNNHSKIYFVKQLNDNAIVLSSIYTRELDKIFRIPTDLDGMNIYLVDDNNNIIYSSDEDAIGTKADTVEKYLYTVNTLKTSDWHVICTLPQSLIRDELNTIAIYTLTLSFFISLIIVLLAWLIIKRAYTPVKNIVYKLEQKAEHDQLTGLMNRTSFKKMVEAFMLTGGEKTFIAFVMLDMDNFKSVNDIHGHQKGDEVLIRFSKLLKSCSDASMVTGRMGGDEFAVFASYDGMEISDATIMIEQWFSNFKEAFATEFAEFYDDCRLSVSGGAVVVPNDTLEFKELYSKADTELYNSKKSGKNKFTLK